MRPFPGDRPSRARPPSLRSSAGARGLALALALGAVAGACGARAGFDPDPPAERATCTWRVGATTIVRPGSGIVGLARDGDGYLLATAGGPARVQRLRADLQPAGEPHAVLPAPPPGSGSFGLANPTLAVAAGRRAILGWDSLQGCRFQALTSDGAPLGMPVTLGALHCTSLEPVAGGYTMLESSNPGIIGQTGVVTLDATGSVLRRSGNLFGRESAGAHVRRAMYPDGSFLLAWTSRGYNVRHVAADGSSMGPHYRFGATPTEVLHGIDVALVPWGAALLWSEGVDSADGGRERRMALAPLDRAGQSVAPATYVIPPTAPGFGVDHVAVASAGRDVLVARVEPVGGAPSTRLRVYVIDGLGRARGDRLDVGPALEGTLRIVVAPQGGGVLVAYESLGPESTRYVTVTALACE